MVSRVLVFQHVSYCPLASFGQSLALDGVSPITVRLDQGAPIPELSLFDALIVLGGPQDVWQEREYPWLAAEKAAIRRWVSAFDKPLLGVCLGHQLLADALGGSVRPAQKAEAGLATIEITGRGRAHPLMRGFQATKRAIQFHGAEVTALPERAELLATSADCPIAAFSAGSAAFGIQYHAEATDTLVDAWAETAGGLALLEKANGPLSGDRVRREVKEAMPELVSNAMQLFANFMGIVRERAGRGVPA